MKVHGICRVAKVAFKKVGETSLLTLNVASDRKFKKVDEEKKTDFFNCKVWGKLADVMQNYIFVGKQININGILEMEEYTRKDGVKVSYACIRVSEIDLLADPKNKAFGKKEETLGVNETSIKEEVNQKESMEEDEYLRQLGFDALEDAYINPLSGDINFL
ncbi:MAG: single-stranded DNA-binding protein [Eubacteriaceae bacterium]